MNWRRIPAVPTLVVLAAVAVMVWLGVWQLQRLRWKEDLLSRYTAADKLGEIVDISFTDSPEKYAYRRVRWGCPVTGRDQLVAGRNSAGQPGWAHVVVCSHPSFDFSANEAVVLGWSKKIEPIVWRGGQLTGVLVPGPKSGVAMPPKNAGTYDQNTNREFHIVAAPPLAGLQANARPDPHDVPNNHLSYAVQWFLFALTALVIYALALRKRLKAG